MPEDLLPCNATPLERALANLSLRLEEMSVPNADIYNPKTCPNSLLPWLAWAFSVDVWCDTWDEATKRRMIENSLLIHQKKGTRAAVLKVLESLKINAELEEWWQAIPKQTPHTFTVSIDSNSTREQTQLTPTLYPVLTDLVNRTKPERSHYTLQVKAISQAPLALGLNIKSTTRRHLLCITDRKIPFIQPKLSIGLLFEVTARLH